jgi:hypothetical protein
MTTKPPLGLAASGHTDGSDSDLEDLSDEIDVDSSQDVTVEASEESTLELSGEESGVEVEEEVSLDAAETPPPLSSLMPPGMLSSTPPPRRAPTLLGLPLPSLPLPGVTARPGLQGLDQGDLDEGDDDEVTILAHRPIADDDEEATKVEPAATALHAAASRDEDDDEVTTALSAQASVEREKALRKSVPPSLDLPLPSYRADRFGGGGAGDEFEDPEDDDGVDLEHDTPASISVEHDVIASSPYAPELEEPSSELEAVLAPRRPVGSPPLGSPIASFGRSGEGFGSARLPTPSAGYGFSLPSPGQAPAPSNSPFSARLAPVGSPYAATRTTSAPMPAIQIPAPSGAAALPSSSSGLFFKVQVPVVGLLALLVAAGGGGVLLGAKLWRSGPPASAALSATPVQAVAIQQVPPSAPAQPAPAAEAPPAGAAAPAPAAAAASGPTPPPPPPPSAAPPAVEQAAAPAPTPRPAKHVAARPFVRKTPVAGASGAAPAAPARPKPKAKVAKGWVDPFAE